MTTEDSSTRPDRHTIELESSGALPELPHRLTPEWPRDYYRPTRYRYDHAAALTLEIQRFAAAPDKPGGAPQTWHDAMLEIDDTDERYPNAARPEWRANRESFNPDRARLHWTGPVGGRRPADELTTDLHIHLSAASAGALADAIRAAGLAGPADPEPGLRADLHGMQTKAEDLTRELERTRQALESARKAARRSREKAHRAEFERSLAVLQRIDAATEPDAAELERLRDELERMTAERDATRTDRDNLQRAYDRTRADWLTAADRAGDAVRNLEHATARMERYRALASRRGRILWDLAHELENAPDGTVPAVRFEDCTIDAADLPPAPYAGPRLEIPTER